MNIFELVFILVIGLIIGSFLNVVVIRLPDLYSIISTRSHCIKCKKQLTWRDLIPFFSFIFLAGKCRYCNKKISWQYPTVELGTAIIFLLLYLKFGLTIYSCYLLLVTSLLIVIFVYDLMHQLIADQIIFPLYIITIVYLLIYPGISLYNHLFGGAVGLIIIASIYLITKGKGIGFGDITLATSLGLIVGWPEILVIIFFAFVIGAIIGLFLIYSKKKSFKDAVAFGPFLIIGFYIALFWGEKIINWYLGI